MNIQPNIARAKAYLDTNKDRTRKYLVHLSMRVNQRSEVTKETHLHTMSTIVRISVFPLHLSFSKKYDPSKDSYIAKKSLQQIYQY